MVLAPEGSTTADLLARLIDADPSQPLEVAVRRGAESLTVSLTPREWSTRTRLARVAAAFIPAGSDTSEGKLRALMVVLAAVLACVLVSNVSRYFGEAMIAEAVLSAPGEHGQGTSCWPSASGMPTEWRQWTNSPSPIASRALVPIRVMIFILTAT